MYYSKLRVTQLLILAIESSQPHASVALMETKELGLVQDLALLNSTTLPTDLRTAQALLPSMAALFSNSNWHPKQVDLVCVATGPGSFTGLRIGVTTAKSWAYAIGAKLVGVHTSEAMAKRVLPKPERLWTVLDAERKELFVSCFSAQEDPQTTIMTVDHWLDELQTGDHITGPPLARLKNRLPAGVTKAPEELWNPHAVEVGKLGFAALQSGLAVDPMQLVPNYYRRSAAEEKILRTLHDT